MTCAGAHTASCPEDTWGALSLSTAAVYLGTNITVPYHRNKSAYAQHVARIGGIEMHAKY
jgi:hypothetical protein